VELDATANDIGGTSTSALTRRLLGGILLAVAAFVGTHQAAVHLAATDPALAIVFATASALGVAALALSRTVSPVLATQADLRVRYEAALADALRDPLTSLGNHRAFHEELDRQVETSLRYGMPLGLMLIDLDEFKTVNDTRGHAGGDRVLRGFGALLSGALRRADRAYRIGGDEFAVILPHTDLDGARVVARRLLAQALQPALRVDDLDSISFSAGLSAMPELAENRARLYAQADAAMYAAKRGGRTDVVAYAPGLDTGFEETDAAPAASAVADVIARGLLRPVYQPIVALASRRVLGVEGLIRPVPPAPFTDPGALFTAARAGGRVTALDLACIEAIVSGAVGLPDDQFLTINVSPSTVEAPEFTTGALLGILARHGLPADRVVIELTEHQPIHDVARVRERLGVLQRAGVRVAADDVGAGNAGLRLLAEISFDVIKLDLGLVQGSASSAPTEAVVGSVVALASRMGALVVAEGIEEPAQLDQLLELGIEAGQGYLLGRPGALQPVVAHLEPVPVAMSEWRESIGLPTAS
jgi:diguanylate cyclase (GGDEF)-like protein